MQRLKKVVNKDPAFPDQEPLIPVALRVDVGGMEISTTEKILPHRLRVWTGEAWKPIRFTDPEFLEEMALERGEEQKEFGALRPTKRAAQQVTRKFLLETGSQLTKEEVEYVSVAPGTQRCATCMSAYQHVATGTFLCDVVIGNINPEAWCRLWEGGGDGF
jgi:hypothetical protein